MSVYPTAMGTDLPRHMSPEEMERVVQRFVELIEANHGMQFFVYGPGNIRNEEYGSSDGISMCYLSDKGMERGSIDEQEPFEDVRLLIQETNHEGARTLPIGSFKHIPNIRDSNWSYYGFYTRIDPPAGKLIYTAKRDAPIAFGVRTRKDIDNTTLSAGEKVLVKLLEDPGHQHDQILAQVIQRLRDKHVQAYWKEVFDSLEPHRKT